MTWNECFKRYIMRRFGEGYPAKAADSLGVVRSKVYYWLRGSLPREDMRAKVEEWSGGKVPSELHVRKAG